VGVLGVLGLICGPAGAQTASPTPPPPKLKLDIDRHVEEALAREASRGLPRFETSIEVVGKTPQIMLERFFGGVDLECAPGGAAAGGGAPTEVEMRAVRPHPSPYVDFAALTRLLTEKLKRNRASKAPARYYLYRVRSPEGVRHVLREERVPAVWVQGLAGTTYELVETFPDVESAVRAWKRMEHGFASPVGPPASPPPPWVATTCRPRK